MKQIIILLAISLQMNNAFCQNGKQQSFEKAVKEIVAAFKTKNNKVIKNYTDATTGIFMLHRQGVYDRFMKMEKLDLNDYAQAIVSLELPYYSCDTDLWTQYGIFADTLKVSHALSDVCKNLNKYLFEEPGEKIPSKEINRYVQWENQSRRVVCCKKKGSSEDLIFHLVWKNNRWYLWLIDKVLTDCSA
jgi:hypothetical protein